MTRPKASPATHIIIQGARQHNLQNVDLVLPKNKLIVFTGLSGSGKSSLAFDTIYAEGQRKYVESLSSYARQFLGIMQKPEVDRIDGLSPAISIDQKTTSHNPRSTVGTITEIYDYLRLLFARIGHPRCPDCGTEISPQTLDQIVSQVFDRIVSAAQTDALTRWAILSPVVKDKRGEFSGLFQNLRKKGFQRVRIDGRTYSLDEDLVLIKTNRHHISVYLERITLSKKQSRDSAHLTDLRTRLGQAIDQALDLSDGLVIASHITDASLDFPADPQTYQDHLFSQQLACPQCNLSFPPPEPRLFSFNTPHGACGTCDGLGSLLQIDPDKIIAPDLTLSEGAIIPMATMFSTDSWSRRKIDSLMRHFGSDLKTTYSDLPDRLKHILLHGSLDHIRVSGPNQAGRQVSFSFQHEGIINTLERRFHDTASDYIRAELSKYFTSVTCPVCQGARLKPEALSVTVLGRNIDYLVNLPIDRCLAFIHRLDRICADHSHSGLNQQEKTIAPSILRELIDRLTFLVSVGLSYLTLGRQASTLAGGEAQRIRLASQIGTGLTGVLYVLDEPTIGLHPRDNQRLLETLLRLRDLGNTVIVVEHDPNIIRNADYIVDFGPSGGAHGGHVVAQGNPDRIITSTTLTGQYLSGKKAISRRVIDLGLKQLPQSLKFSTADPVRGHHLVLKGASQHNLQHLDVSFPLGTFTVVTGVSGSGKSSLVHDTLYPAIRAGLDLSVDKLGAYTGLQGLSHITKVNLIDQAPIGRTPRSNPATYTKSFDLIRNIFAATKDARQRGYRPGRFSFNVKGGRCEACQGGGQVKISMQFLSDIFVTCEVCRGTRYNTDTRMVKYKGLSISQVLDLTIDQAYDMFKNHTGLVKKLATLQAVGLGYIKLGQPAPTLSGGEAQRVKLAKELSVNSPGHTVYLLDEPTTGLHFEDVKKLLTVLRQLVNNNNTVIVIEHNLDVVKNADWIIDLGPEGGADGGQVVATGTPTDIMASSHSYTGRYLNNIHT